MRLTAEQRRALSTLAAAGPRGCVEALMVHAHGFTVEALAGLVRGGLASVEVKSVRAGRSPVEVIRMKITAAGLRALSQ